MTIRVRDVAKTFSGKREVRALERVSFDVAEGEFVAVLGPSGCGKSTLLRLIAGLLAPDPGGAIEVRGKPVREPSDDIGVVFQTYNLLPWLTVERNLRLVAEIKKLDPAELDRRIDPMLELLRLAQFRDRHPHELSGGMRQRAALGQILILRPPVLLLDEPFGALDALTRDQLNVELLRLWQESRRTVMLVTHSIAEAVFLADRVLVMSDRPGHIIRDLPIELPRPREPQATKGTLEFAAYVVELSKLMGVA